jgi:hypothetical protein
MPKAVARNGVIHGAMIMAPITTAALLLSSPSVAIAVAPSVSTTNTSSRPASRSKSTINWRTCRRCAH